MIYAERSVGHSHLYSPAHMELVGVKFRAQAVLRSSFQNTRSILYGEEAFFAEYVHEIGQTLGRHCRDHFVADLGHIIFPSHIARHCVSAEEGSADFRRNRLGNATDHPQHLEFVLGVQAVAAFDFNRTRAFGHHLPHPLQALPVKFVFRSGVEQVGGIQDSAATSSNLGIREAADLVFEFQFTAPRPHYMGVGVAECRKDHSAARVNLTVYRRGGIPLYDFSPEIEYPVAVEEQPGITEAADLAHSGALLSGSVGDAGQQADVANKRFHQYHKDNTISITKSLQHPLEQIKFAEFAERRNFASEKISEKCIIYPSENLGNVIMKRKIYDQLLKWKQEKNGTTGLMIEGARRVGKSYIAEEFARNEYESFILIDFSKAPQRVKGWFDEYLEDVDTLLQNIQLHYKKRLTPRKSLIIFDEVQKCPKAREAIKTLVEDGRFDYLETGSLISIKKNVENIVIPSEEDGIEMHPMDFEEFLWAMGNEVLMPYIRNKYEEMKPMGDFHREAMHYFRQYLIVGGMPQAVAEYAASRDFTKVDAIKRQILRLYKNDIKKFAGGLTARVSSIYDAIPGQLQKKEKQFTLSALKDEARMREYDSAFFWLDDAKMVNICYNTTAPNIGLQLNEDRTTLKCYFCDTGLLISLAFSARGIVTNEIYQKLMFDKLEIDEGMLVENVVAQMLKTAGSKLFFYNNYDKEKAENRMQIDFLIQKEIVTSRHNISPIEVKSSTNYTLTSIRKCIRKFGQYLSTPYVLHTNDVEVKEGLTFLPLYMTPLL